MMAPVKTDRKSSFRCHLMKNGNVMGFRGYRSFSPKSSVAKYSTLGASEANFRGKNPRMILREVRYKNLDASYKTNPDFWDCFGWENPISYSHKKYGNPTEISVISLNLPLKCIKCLKFMSTTFIVCGTV